MESEHSEPWLNKRRKIDGDTEKVRYLEETQIGNYSGQTMKSEKHHFDTEINADGGAMCGIKNEEEFLKWTTEDNHDGFSGVVTKKEELDYSEPEYKVNLDHYEEMSGMSLNLLFVIICFQNLLNRQVILICYVPLIGIDDDFKVSTEAPIEDKEETSAEDGSGGD